MVDQWLEENEKPYQDAHISLNWYELIGSGPGFHEEKDVTFDKCPGI